MSSTRCSSHSTVDGQLSVNQSPRAASVTGRHPDGLWAGHNEEEVLLTQATLFAIYLRSGAFIQTASAEQLFRCQAYAAAHGWQISAVFSDNGASGMQDRAGLQAMQTHLQGGGAGIVLVDDVVRLSRDPDLLQAFCRDCEQTGASIFTVDGEFDMASLSEPAATTDSRDRLSSEHQPADVRRQQP